MFLINKIKVITDSTNDLNSNLINRYDIDVIPLYVEFGEESFKDGIELTPKELFQMVKEKNMLPKTSGITPYDYYVHFRTYIEQGYDVVAVLLSSQLSATYQNALIAAAEFPRDRIRIVDSKNLSTGIGSLVLDAALMARAGLPIDDIDLKLQTMTRKVKTQFAIDTLEYLYKGGRCNALQNILGSMLKIRPIIKVVDGKMIVGGKVRGNKRKALDLMLSATQTDRDQLDYNRIFITHSLGSEAEAQYLKSELSKMVPGAEIIITHAGCVISSHCGPKTIGIIYQIK